MAALMGVGCAPLLFLLACPQPSNQLCVSPCDDRLLHWLRSQRPAPALPPRARQPPTATAPAPAANQALGVMMSCTSACMKAARMKKEIRTMPLGQALLPGQSPAAAVARAEG